ncbi:MAG: hypothetical protein ACT4O2_00600, partial [Beijerinckiaceae bacterium]
TLGISTLVFVVPLPLALAHQAGALLLMTAAIWTLYEMGETGSHSNGTYLRENPAKPTLRLERSGEP